MSSVFDNGGLIGRANTPTPISAKGVWSLRRQSLALREGIWPVAPIVKDGLVLYLDAANPLSYPGTGTTWSDLSPSGYDFTLSSASAFNSSGPKYMDFNGSYGGAYRSTDTAETGNITYVLATRIKESTAVYRTLTRGLAADHPVIIENGSYDMGTYDNDGGSFRDSGYNQNSLPNFGTSDWIILYFRWNAGGGYKMSYNDTPSIIRADLSGDSASQHNSGIGMLGWYQPLASQYWGDIGMFAMYDRYLTDAELSQNYEALKDRFGL